MPPLDNTIEFAGMEVVVTPGIGLQPLPVIAPAPLHKREAIKPVPQQTFVIPPPTVEEQSAPYGGKRGEVLTRADDLTYGGQDVWAAAGAVPPATYIFDIGLIELAGKVDLEPATQTVIGGLIEAPLDNKSYARQNAAWIEVTGATPLDFGIGLTLTGTTVDLDPANFTPGEIGGITTDVRSATHGLLLDDTTGLLTAPLATDLLAGSIVEPPPNDKNHVRRRDLAGVSTWVESTGAYIWGIGLEESTTVPGEINLLPAKYDPVDLGGVYILPATGIGIAQDGGLGGIPATDTTIGMFFDAPYDGKSYTRTNGQWASTATMAPTDMPIAGYTIAELGAVYIVPDRALRVEIDGALDVQPAGPDQLGVIFDPPYDSGNPDITYTRKWGSWVESKDTKIAGNTASDTGVIWVPDERGLDLSANGSLTLLPASDNRLGGIFDVPPFPDDKVYVRKYAQWVESQAEQVYIAGVGPDRIGISYVQPASGLSITDDGGLSLVPTTDSQYGGIMDAPYDSKDYVRNNGAWERSAGTRIAGLRPEETGVVYIIPGLGVSLGADGGLGIHPTTPDQIGGIVDAPYDNKDYVRYNGKWEEALTSKPAGHTADKVGVVFVPEERGLDLDDTTGSLTLLPASDNRLGGIFDVPSLPNNKSYVRQYAQWVEAEQANVRIAGLRPEEVGVVYVVPGLGISLGDDGGIGVHPSTPDQHGTIVDAPYDSKDYVRNNGDWLESVSTKPAGNTLAEIGVVYVPDDRGLTLGTDGALMSSIATDTQVGAIFDAPGDGKEYVRKLSQWVPSLAATGAVIVQDTPPVGAMPNQLWWDSNSGDLFILYQDMDSIQWVQINSSGGGSTTGDYLPLTGGTVTGNFTVSAAIPFLTINSTDTQYSALRFQRNDVSRFELQLLGSEDIALYSYSDTGAFIGEIFTIGRNSRVMDFVFAPTVAGAPIVMMTELDVANDRIARLEERLARIEGRS